MKRAIVILLIVVGTAAPADTEVFPSYQQAERLVAAVWKASPQSIDVTYYVTVMDGTKTEQDFRLIYERAHEQMYGPVEQLNSYMLNSREKFIQLNVERCLKEQQDGGRTSKLRIRYDGNHQRIDRVDGKPARTVVKQSGHEQVLPEKVLGPDTPFDMSFTEVTDQNDHSERFEYLHSKSTATAKRITRRSNLENSTILKLVRIPNDLLLQMKLGTRTTGSPDGPCDVDETKVEQLSYGALDGIRVEVQPAVGAPDDKDRIEIALFNQDKPSFYESSLICAREDYSQVYYSEVRNPITKRPISTRTCSNFDSQGFPYRATLVEYDSEGKVKIRETYRVESVRLNTPISDEVFEFNPPEDYAVRDLRLSPAEQEAEEVARLNAMLKHELWTDRFRALTSLRQILKDDPVRLRGVAEGMLDDQHAGVRQYASRILQQIDPGM
ncbi:MAG: hypothetical protein JXN61_09740 [Sedimentisphaerales bacterium]|nr:hypothetical protein [Sedimentisphaerales bacterium]